MVAFSLPGWSSGVGSTQPRLGVGAHTRRVVLRMKTALTVTPAALAVVALLHRGSVGVVAGGSSSTVNAWALETQAVGRDPSCRGPAAWR